MGACYQGSQEFSASAVAYRPGSLADAQGLAVACPPRTPVCSVASYLPLHVELAFYLGEKSRYTKKFAQFYYI